MFCLPVCVWQKQTSASGEAAAAAQRLPVIHRGSPAFLQLFPPTMIGLPRFLPAAAQGDNQSNQRLSRSAVVTSGGFPAFNGA